MNARRITLLVALGLLALPALASASWTPTLTAAGVRMGDHPAFVRVVVDFTGAALNDGEVEARSFGNGGASIRVTAPNVSSRAMAQTAYGVHVRVLESSGRLRIQMDFNRGLKYQSYAIFPGNRLVIDLWKGAPPAPAAEIRTAPDGCLSLQSWHVTPGRITASGGEHDLFEHQLIVNVRGQHGQLLGTTPHGVLAAAGAWHTRVNYTANHRQIGTLEAVDFSAKDGALDCIAQVRVTLPAS